MTILHIDSSARFSGSTTRDLTARVVAKLGGETLRRDLTEALPHITESWVNANYTPADQRDVLQHDTLSLSDTLINELKSADTIVIGAPIYNFSIPASLKTWIDLICRAGVTFRYTENGPDGLLTGKRAIIVAASGGVKIGSESDFAIGYLRHVLGFIGISDVQMVAANQMMGAGDDALTAALAQVDQLAA